MYQQPIDVIQDIYPQNIQYQNTSNVLQTAQNPSKNAPKTTMNKEVEVVDLNSYAAKKTALGGALGMGLISSNTEQLVSIISIEEEWSTLNRIKFWLLVLSLTLQVSFISNFRSAK